MRRIELERAGTRLVGQESGPDARPLLLHAGRDRRQAWDGVMSALTALGVGSVAYDQRSHGESGGSQADGLPDYAADTVAMICAMRCPIVAGNSLGGFAALAALADPDVERLVAGLGLVDVLPDPEFDPVRAILKRDAPHLTQTPLVRDITGRREVLRAIAEGLRLPVLRVCGGSSWLGRNAQEQARFLRMVPRASLAVIADAGRLVPRDAPDALANMLAEFMASPAVADRHRAVLAVQPAR